MYLCSERDLTEFETGNIWKDMVTELTIWLGRIRNELEDPNNEKTDKELHRLAGSAEAVRNTLRLPETIRNNMAAINAAEDHSEEG